MRLVALRRLLACTCAAGAFLLTTGDVGATCSDGLTAVATFLYPERCTGGSVVVACENMAAAGPNSTIEFHCDTETSGKPWLTLARRAEWNNNRWNLSYGGHSIQQVLSAPDDMLGNTLLGISGYPARSCELTYGEVRGYAPPLRLFQNTHVFTGSRSAAVDVTFDDSTALAHHCSDVMGTGLPSLDLLMNASINHEAAQAERAKWSSSFEWEGLIGGFLPILLMGFPSLHIDGAYWEMSVVPVADGTGNEQPVWIRFLKPGPNNTHEAIYFDTFAYDGVRCHGSSLADCGMAGDYYSAILDQHFYWEKTWLQEGAMSLVLPGEKTGTDGHLLRDHALHAIVLDMITRTQTVWPRYGTNPGYEQPGVGAHGFQEICTSSLATALEWGMFEYAKGVLDNYLSYFVRSRGRVLYRGLEMSQLGRLLVLTAEYYFYTGDETIILRHQDKLRGIAEHLYHRRQMALEQYPAADDPRHGMPTGNDEADMFIYSVLLDAKTELAFISIAAEMWRGFRDLGDAIASIVAAHSTATSSWASASVHGSSLNGVRVPVLAELGQNLTAEAPAILRDLQHSMLISKIPGTYPRCLPYVAGAGTCDELNATQATSDRASESWRTYSELMLSGALDAATTAELLAYHQSVPRAGGSRLKLGILSGSGGNVMSGDDLETFTIHGWGWGLLQADLVEPFLLQFYALSAHAYTRGTFVAPESAFLDRSKVNVPFATPAGVTTPLMLKWLLLCEHPVSHALWVAKATPRNWLAEGETIEASKITSAYGRLSFKFESQIETMRRILVNLTLPSSWAEPHVRKPLGGVVIRLRTPSHTNVGKNTTSRWTMVGAKQGDGKLLAFNASKETVQIPRDALCCKASDQSCGGACLHGSGCCMSIDLMTQLQSIVISYSQS